MATGHIRKRINAAGKVCYQLIVELERDPQTGKRDRKYHTIQGTRKQAEATLRQMIAELEGGGIIAPSAIKLGSWMQQWLDNYLPNIEKTTRAGYEEKIRNYILPTLGQFPLSSLRNPHIQNWIMGMSDKGLSPKTIRNVYNNLNSALKKAVVLRMISYNPCEGVVLPKLKHYEGKVYDAEQIKQALDAAKGSDLYLLILLEAEIGLRRGELAALKWEDIDLTQKTLHVCSNRVLVNGKPITKAPKTASGTRTVTMGESLVAALRRARLEYYNDRASRGDFRDLGYVIRKPNGEPYNPDSITQKWERFLERNNLPHIRLHDLRHSNATLLIQSGISPKVVQQRLGHADVQITLNTYTHVLPEMDEEAAAKLDDMLFAMNQN